MDACSPCLGLTMIDVGQAAFSRRRSKRPRAPVTRARTEPMPAGSISGTGAELTSLARRKPMFSVWVDAEKVTPKEEDMKDAGLLL